MNTGGGTSTLTLKYPTWDYDLLYERDQIADTMVRSGKVPVELLDAVDNAHHGMATDTRSEYRKYQYLALEFKSPVKLDAKRIHEKFNDSTGQLPIEGKFKFASGNTFIYFRIARTDTESYKRGKGADVAKSKGAALFEDSPEKRPDQNRSGMQE